MEKDFKAFNHGKKKIDLSEYHPILMRPIEIHLKEDGSITNEPTLTIVMIHPSMDYFVIAGEVSLKMFNDGIKDIGYELKKIET